MKILVEIDLPDVEPDDIYKPNSGWFNEPGCIDISSFYLNEVEGKDPEINLNFRFKYIGQVHEDSPRP